MNYKAERNLKAIMDLAPYYLLRQMKIISEQEYKPYEEQIKELAKELKKGGNDNEKNDSE